MMAKSKLPRAKRTWLKPARDFFRNAITGWELQGEDIQLLTAVAERLNQYWECQAAIDRDGICLTSPNGMKRKHPCCEVQKSAWQGFLAGLRQLNLTDDPKRPGRPPLGPGGGLW
jgi:hypothetical protein